METTKDYCERRYLSATEAARFLGVKVRTVHEMVRKGLLVAQISASGQKRFDIRALRALNQQVNCSQFFTQTDAGVCQELYRLELNETEQKIYVANAQSMEQLQDDSVHLVVTSPPYFNAKMYAKQPILGDLSEIHDLDEWLSSIQKVWSEVYRVLQPGRKLFINIMNLPIRLPSGGFRTLNLVGKTVDLCEALGFVFRRDIVWHKTNSARAHFGTYPYPGGILINHMHEFILEFEKPAPKGYNKYAHLTKEQKEASKLDKEFWLEIKKSDVWSIKPAGSGDQRTHVAPFPVELPSRLIKAFSYVNETVLDPFLGSGTTLVAAVQLKRNGIGYEINPQIAQEAFHRLKAYQTSMDSYFLEFEARGLDKPVSDGV